MYEMDLALNNLQWLICHKTKPNYKNKPKLDLEQGCKHELTSEDRTHFSVMNYYRDELRSHNGIPRAMGIWEFDETCSHSDLLA